MWMKTQPRNTHGVGSSTHEKTEGLISQRLRRKTNHKESLTNGWKQPQQFPVNMRNPMGQLHFSSFKKMEDLLIIPCLQWKENVQRTNCALGKTWLMQLLLKKRKQQHWHFFNSGPPFKHLPLHLKWMHMHVLILKWDFSSIKHAKRLSLAGSVALVMLVNSHPYVPDGHDRKLSFPKPSAVQCCSDCSRKLSLENNQTMIYITDLTAKNHNAEHFKWCTAQYLTQPVHAELQQHKWEQYKMFPF